MFLVIYMYTITKDVQSELIINKSRFITFIYRVKSVSEINQILSNLKNNYKDATHYCYAYVINNIKKASDDGEPSHTAGRPMLNVLENKKINNVLAVVIRYFGGIKLGAGGLVRAYTNAVSSALKSASLTPVINELKIRIEFRYEDINKVNYLLRNYKITYKEFSQNVIYEFIYEEGKYPDGIEKNLIKKEVINK